MAAIAVTLDEEREILAHLRAWGFYRKHGKKHTEYYCTSCHDWHDTEEKVEHNKKFPCRHCGREIFTYAIGYLHSGLNSVGNFVLVRLDENDGVYLNCIRAMLHYQNSEPGDLEPEFDCSEVERYHITLGNARRYFYKNDGKLHWTRKAIQEPCHFETCRGYNNDNSYIIIGLEKIEQTPLRRSHIAEYSENGGRYTVSALAFFSKHPNMEILWETGFEYLAEHMYNTKEIPQGINLKSNNIKEILGIETKRELECLSSLEIDKFLLSDYKRFKAAFSELNANQCAEYFEKYGESIREVLKIKSYAPQLTFRQIDNYIKKQAEIARLACGRAHPSERDMLIMWRDMLILAKSLNYDMADNIVVRPKNLVEVHNRFATLDANAKQNIKNETTQQQFAELAHKYQLLQYSRYGLQVVIPQKYGDIISEGAILSHCVGSYADEYCRGDTIILFVRRKEALETPYYTMEVNIDTAEIVQFYGYKNNVVSGGGEIKPLRIRKFEKRYQKYLDSVKIEGIFQNRKSRRKSA